VEAQNGRTEIFNCIALYCIVSIHLYSASCSAHQKEALPVQETQREERMDGQALRLVGFLVTSRSSFPCLSRIRMNCLKAKENLTWVQLYKTNIFLICTESNWLDCYRHFLFFVN